MTAYSLDRWTTWALVEVRRGRSLRDVIRRLVLIQQRTEGAKARQRERREMDAAASRVTAMLDRMKARRRAA